MSSPSSQPARAIRLASLTSLLCMLSGTSWAGGIMLYEAGQEGAALSNAGAAVLATDPSVLMNNPAGLTQLAGTQVNANGQMLFGHVRFSRDGSNQFDGNEGGEAVKFLPGTSFFISHQLDERSTIGFGMYGTFGLAVDYDDDWAGRYFTQEAAIIGVTLQPTYAYKISDDLSVGIGPRIMYGYYRTEAAINNNLLGLADRPDGQLEYKDTDVGLGVNLGVLYRLNERTLLGLAYNSKIDLHFKDRPSFDDVSTPLLKRGLDRLNLNRLKVDMEVPQTVLLSASYDLNPQWKLFSSLGWQQWSQFGKIGVEVDANDSETSRGIDRDYKDTWHASLGAQYQATPKWRWSMGLGYDSSMVDDSDRTVDNPTGESWRLSAGFNYKVDDGLDLHMAYTLVWLGDLEEEQTKRLTGRTVSGDYKNTAIHIIGGGAVWRY